MSNNDSRPVWPGILDRVLEVMRHFYCQTPEELEKLLGMEAGHLCGLFRLRATELPQDVLEALTRAGVRSAYLLRGETPMLSERLDRDRLNILHRHAARLLSFLAGAETGFQQSGLPGSCLRRVTDSQGEPVSLDEELAALLVEALQDRRLRERLIEFIRKEASNRHSPRG